MLTHRNHRVARHTRFLDNQDADDEDAQEGDSEGEDESVDDVDDVADDKPEGQDSRGSFATMGVSVEDRAFSFNDFEGDADSANQTRPQDVFSQSHPLVKETLQSMGDKLKDVQDAQATTMTLRDDLQSQQQKAMNNMGRGAAYQRLMASAKTASADEDKVLLKLKSEEGDLKREHDSVALKLESIMQPRMAAMQRQLDTRNQAIERTSAQMKKWDGLRKKNHDIALQALVDRKQKAQAVKDAQEVVLMAQKKEAAAETSYNDARRQVTTDIESYKLAKTRYEGTEAQMADEREDLQEAEKSMARTKEIFAMERKRIDDALAFSEAKLTKRIQSAKHQSDKSKHKFEMAKEHLHEWQTQQKALEKQAAEMKADFEGKQKLVDEKRKSVFDAATSKAGEQAVAAMAAQSDFHNDDWAWSGDGEFGGMDGMDFDDASLD